MSIFTGSAVALVTPFLENGDVDFDKLKELVEFHVAHKTDAIVICGTTGEASTMSTEEKQELVKYCVKVVNKKRNTLVRDRYKCVLLISYLNFSFLYN